MALVTTLKTYQVCSVAELPKDMKRMLSVQIRELVHEIEDFEFSREFGSQRVRKQKGAA